MAHNDAFGRLRSRKYPALVLSGPTRSGPARPYGGPHDGRDRYLLPGRRKLDARFAGCWFACPNKTQVFDASTVERVAPGVTRSKRLARFPPSRARCLHSGKRNGREPCSLPFPTYSAHGGLRQDPSEAGESPAVARNLRRRSCEMRPLSSAYDSRNGGEVQTWSL